ncbi:hypothetical protein HZ326_8034 [Fusarium oxysporum f. sp. albedinis]|nr:hypothetical protein HZ326_8034 [Fusarium oxysporum f. sp. albedinis]
MINSIGLSAQSWYLRNEQNITLAIKFSTIQERNWFSGKILRCHSSSVGEPWVRFPDYAFNSHSFERFSFWLYFFHYFWWCCDVGVDWFLMLGSVLRWSRFCQEPSGSSAVANRLFLPCQDFCLAHLVRQYRRSRE